MTAPVRWQRALPWAVLVAVATVAAGQLLALVLGRLAPAALPAAGATLGQAVRVMLAGVAYRAVYLLLAIPYVVGACLGSMAEAVRGTYRWHRFWGNGLRYLGAVYRLGWRLLWTGLLAAGGGVVWTLLLRRLHAPLGADAALAGDVVIALAAACHLSVIGPCTVAPRSAPAIRAGHVLGRHWHRVLAGVALWVGAAIWALGLLTLAGGHAPWARAAAWTLVLYVFCVLYAWEVGLTAGAPGPGRGGGEAPRCGACGAPVSARDAFCPSCGSSLALPAVPAPEGAVGRRACRRSGRAVAAAMMICVLVAAPGAALAATTSASGANASGSAPFPAYAPSVSSTCALESAITSGAYSLQTCRSHGASAAAFAQAERRLLCQAWKTQSAAVERQLKADEAAAAQGDLFERTAVDMLRLIVDSLTLTCLLEGASGFGGAGVQHLKATVNMDVQRLLHAVLRLASTPATGPPGSLLNPLVPQTRISLGSGSTPAALLYAAASKRLFVADPGTDSVWRLPASLARVSGSATLPGAPFAMSHDAAAHLLFVTYLPSSGGSAVAALNTGTLKMRWSDTLSADGLGEGVAYDPGNREVYVGEPCAVAVFGASSGALLSTIPLPVPSTTSCGNEDVTYDPASRTVLVTAFGGSSAKILDQIDPSTGRVARSLCLGTAFQTSGSGLTTTYCAGSQGQAGAAACNSGPHTVYDPANGDLYLASFGGSRLTVLRGGSLRVLGRWQDVGSVAAMAVDPLSGTVFAVEDAELDATAATGAQWFSDAVPPAQGFADVSGSPHTLITDLCGVAMSDSSGDLYVADSANGTVGAIPLNDLAALGTGPMVSTGPPGQATYALVAETTALCNVADPWVAGAFLPVTGPLDAVGYISELTLADPLGTGVHTAVSWYGFGKKLFKTAHATGRSGACGTVGAPG